VLVLRRRDCYGRRRRARLLFEGLSSRANPVCAGSARKPTAPSVNQLPIGVCTIYGCEKTSSYLDIL
jgi:hypothetical protein